MPYVIRLFPSGRRAIFCFACGLESHHPTDVLERFCGRCKAWHQDAPLEYFTHYDRESRGRRVLMMLMHGIERRLLRRQPIDWERVRRQLQAADPKAKLPGVALLKRKILASILVDRAPQVAMRLAVRPQVRREMTDEEFRRELDALSVKIRAMRARLGSLTPAERRDLERQLQRAFKLTLAYGAQIKKQAELRGDAMNPRPSLDTVERLLHKHQGACVQPCEGCELASEVVALHRVLAFVAQGLEEVPDRPPPNLEPAALGPRPVEALERLPEPPPGRGLPDKRE